MNTSQDYWFFRRVLIAGAAFALLSVMIGAFAAHGLKPVLGTYALGLIETAARYQMYHALALLCVGILSTTMQLPPGRLKFSAFAFMLGIVLFSGSLYLLAFSAQRWLGLLTPLGGAGFIFGWLGLIAALLKNSVPPKR